MSVTIANPVLKSLVKGILVWLPFWLGTTIFFALIGLAYVLILKEDIYLASQAILVRDEANGASMRLGRFSSQAEMKAAQETILEMSKSPQVVQKALETVGPPVGLFHWLSFGSYPSSQVVESIANNSIVVHAPKGTEFGTTEVIYLDFKSNSRDRSIELNKALCDSLEDRLQKVRKARADGVIAELSHARDSARRELASSTEQLHVMEQEAGSDLSDLRGLTDMIAGGATSRTELDQIKNELRQSEQVRQQLMSDHEMLTKAIQDPDSFVIAPSALLNTQPGLKRFREGLVDAQLSGSQLTGRFTDEHPLVLASKTAQGSIAQRFKQELKASLASLDADIAVADDKIRRLENQRGSSVDRLNKLADNRSSYANIAADVKSRISILESSERELAEAIASRDSSQSTSLLTRLDAPIVSDKPVGPSKSTLVALCGIAGFVFGIGFVCLVTPIDNAPSYGRRASDTVFGRRSADASNQNKDVFDPSKETTGRGRTMASHENQPDDVEQINSPGSSSSSAPVATGNVGREKLNVPSRPLFSNSEMADASERSRISELLAELGPLDETYQELSRLKADAPENRIDELALQMRMHELKQFLASKDIVPDSHSMSSDEMKLKPRPTSRAF